MLNTASIVLYECLLRTPTTFRVQDTRQPQPKDPHQDALGEVGGADSTAVQVTYE